MTDRAKEMLGLLGAAGARVVESAPTSKAARNKLLRAAKQTSGEPTASDAELAMDKVSAALKPILQKLSVSELVVVAELMGHVLPDAAFSVIVDKMRTSGTSQPGA